MRTALALPVAILALGASALALNAEADLLPGDRLHGNIFSPGDADELRIWLPAGAVFDAEALAEKGSLVLPSLEVRDPSDGTLDLAAYSAPGPKGVGVKVKKAPAGSEGGTFTFVVAGGGGTAGKYSFRCRTKMPKKVSDVLPLPAGSSSSLSFDAPAGSTLAWKVKASKGLPSEGLAMDGLEAPDASVVVLNALSGKKVPLAQDGTWTLGVRNDGGADTTAEVQVTLTLPPASKRELWLSPFGFGEAPRVTSVTPPKVIDDRVAEGVEILGSRFDPGAAVRLEKGKEPPLEATSFTVDDAGTIHADFDPTAATAPGAWKVVVENPSGATGSRKFTIQAAGNVQLPRGLRSDTEVTWIDFDDEAFANDLVLVGLGSSSKSTRNLAMAGVKSYALFYLRRAFGIQGKSGKGVAESLPVSFCLDKPPTTVGSPGTTYNRIRVGGSTLNGDPSSNPNLPWGNGPLDVGNTAYEDLAGTAGPGYGYRTAILAPSLATSLTDWINVTAPLRSQPLTAADDLYFYPSFAPQTDAQAQRYRDIVAATHAVGKEMGATLAHFVGRSMGIADGFSGLAYAPQKVGEYAAYASFTFSPGERDTIASVARAGLPGKSKALEANWFPARETRNYLLPDATTTTTYNQGFAMIGGRPDRSSGDIVFDGASGSIPPGFAITTSGALVGNAPLRFQDGTLVGGVYRFVVRYRDTVADETVFFAHRLNVLVNLADPNLLPSEVAGAQILNAQTLATP